jgi:hypothetical protein
MPTFFAGSVTPYVFNGKLEEAVKKAKGMRLKPYYPDWYLFQPGFAQYVASDYEGAVECHRQTGLPD